MGKIPGIYKITNISTNDCYVGSSKDIHNRWKQHRYKLNHNKHHSKYLQNAWNKYGEAAFVMEILEQCELDNSALLLREQFYFDSLKPVYNMCPVSGSPLGYKHSNETKEKVSASLKGNKRNLGTKYSDETKCKMREKQIGHFVSEETKEKISKSLKKSVPDEHLDEMLKMRSENKSLREIAERFGYKIGFVRLRIQEIKKNNA